MLDGLAPDGSFGSSTPHTLKGSPPLLSRPCSNQCFAAPGQGLGRARSQNDTAFSSKAKSNKRKLTRKRGFLFSKRDRPLCSLAPNDESPYHPKKSFLGKIAIQNMEGSFFQVGKMKRQKEWKKTCHTPPCSQFHTNLAERFFCCCCAIAGAREVPKKSNSPTVTTRDCNAEDLFLPRDTAGIFFLLFTSVGKK